LAPHKCQSCQRRRFNPYHSDDLSQVELRTIARHETVFGNVKKLIQ
jgi:hypothetical protein